MKKNKIKLTLSFLLIVEFFTDCSSYQLKQPAAENLKPGAISFCTIYREKSFLGENVSTLVNINFIERKGEGQFVNVPAEVDDDKQLTDRMFLGHDCFIVTGLKPGAQYSFDAARTTYVSGDTQYVITLNIEPEVVFNKIPMVAESGKIKFMGVYLFDAIVTEKGGLFQKDKKAVKILDAGEFLKEPFHGGIATGIYGVFEKNTQGAEAQALKWLLYTQKEGYWHDLAVKRYNELGFKE